MFQVVAKNESRGSKNGVRSDWNGGNTEFLIYDMGRWEWMPAQQYEPLNISEQVSGLNLKDELKVLRSGGSWGQWKAWMVNGAEDRAEGIKTAAAITKAQVALDKLMSSWE